jgi:hypothetical protein
MHTFSVDQDCNAGRDLSRYRLRVALLDRDTVPCLYPATEASEPWRRLFGFLSAALRRVFIVRGREIHLAPRLGRAANVQFVCSLSFVAKTN